MKTNKFRYALAGLAMAATLACTAIGAQAQSVNPSFAGAKQVG